MKKAFFKPYNLHTLICVTYSVVTKHKIYKGKVLIKNMEKEEYNSKFGRYGPVNVNDHPMPEKRTWKRIALEAIAITAMAATLIASCWSCYNYADTQRREALNKTEQGR